MTKPTSTAVPYIGISEPDDPAAQDSLRRIRVVVVAGLLGGVLGLGCYVAGAFCADEFFVPPVQVGDAIVPYGNMFVVTLPLAMLIGVATGVAATLPPLAGRWIAGAAFFLCTAPIAYYVWRLWRWEIAENGYQEYQIILYGPLAGAMALATLIVFAVLLASSGGVRQDPSRRASPAKTQRGQAHDRG